MTPLAKEIVETDWSNMYRLLHENFYPTRLDKSETFGLWVQRNVKIEYFSPAMLIRTASCASEPRKVRYLVLMADGDNCEIDESSWVEPIISFFRDDWEQRERDLALK